MLVRLQLCWLVLLMGSKAATAQTPLTADGSFSAREHIQYLADASGRLTPAQVWQDSARFKPVKTSRFALTIGQVPHWLRFRVANLTNKPTVLVTEIDNQFLSSVQLYLLSANGQLLRNSGPLGWSFLPARRTSNHRNPLLVFQLPPHQRAWVYGRFDNPSQALRIPIRLWTAHAFEVHDRQQRLFWYGLTGILGWLVFTNLILFVLLRERVYAYYGLYMLLVTAYLTVSAGFWLEWLPTTEYGPVNARQFLSVITTVSTLAGFFFIKQFVLLPVWYKRWMRKSFRTAVGLLTAALVLVLIGTRVEWFYIQEIRWLGPLMSLLFGLPVLLMFSLIGYQARPANTDSSIGLWQSPARSYLLGVAPLVLISVGLILRNHAIAAEYGLFGYEGIALGYLFEFTVLSIGLGFRYKQTADERRRLTEETFTQRQALLESQLRAQHQELRATQAQLRLQHEKQRIARDLHDHVGAQLSIIAAQAHTPPEAAPNGLLMSAYAREAIQSLRDTVWALDQPAISLGEFQGKLQQYLNRQQHLHPSCVYQLVMAASTKQTLSSAQALNLFRQVQEAVHNAFKHARASRLEVTCQLVGDQLDLRVSDNGVGFEIAEVVTGRLHYGLRNIERRAAELGGSTQIESTLGRGTCIRITIPLVQ